MKPFKVWAPVLLTVVFLFGCSSSQPASPDSTAPREPIEIRGLDAHSLLGLYTFVCDPDEGAIDINPIREAELHLNALKFLEPPPYLYLTFESPPKFTGNILDVDIGLRHPFVGKDVYSGFDVCGIVITHGSVSGFSDPDINMVGNEDTRLLNADGYTRWWNPAEFPHGDTVFNYIDGLLGTPAAMTDFNSTINGYKYFADGLGKNDPISALDQVMRGISRAGLQNIRHYKIDLSGGLIFNYAVDACWKRPQGSPPYTVPDDFPPSANRQEAYAVIVTELKNSLYYEEDSGNAGGELKLQLDVYDHFNAYFNKVYAECPGAFPLATADAPTGGGEGYSTYELDFTGESLDESGTKDLLITMESEASGYGGLLPGKPVCTYFKYPFSIGSVGCWAVTWGGEEYDFGLKVVVDYAGNSLATGTFREIVDLDPGPDVQEYTSMGKSDVFLSKFNSIGNLLWAVAWGGEEADLTNSVALDDSGNTYVCGKFRGTVDFDPGPAYDEHTANLDKSDVFLSKFDSEGGFQWARTWGGPSNDEGLAVAVDHIGSVYVTGCFYGTCDFDPGEGIDEHTPLGIGDIFLSKFDSNGEFQWARTWGPEDDVDCYYDEGHGVAVDGFDNVYVTGDFHWTCDFDPGPEVEEYTTIEDSGNFLSKFNSDGDFLWARVWSGPYGSTCSRGIAVSGNGEVYVTGYFFGHCDFDPGPGIYLGFGDDNSDVYLTKFDSEGDFIWARTWGNCPDYQGDAESYGVAVDGSGFILVTGRFEGACDFDPGLSIDEHITKGSNYKEDAFLSKLDQDGLYVWARTWGDIDYEAGYGVSIDGKDNIYVTGGFSLTPDFNPGLGTDFHTSNGDYDAFLIKLLPDGFW